MDTQDIMAAGYNEAGNTTGLLSQSFRNRSTAMSTDDLRKARESRAADALKMKDEQLRILTEQNSSLLKSLDKVCMWLYVSFSSSILITTTTIVIH